MSVVIAAGVTDLNLPRIGWKAQGGTVTASSEADGFNAERAATQQTADGWQPDAMPATWELDAGEPVGVNYCGIAAHDLGSTGATVFIEYEDSGWQTVLEISPEDDTALFFLFPAIEAQEWRVRVTGSDAPTLGHIRFGQVLTAPRMATYTGTPIDEGEQVRLRYQQSETGEFLGTVSEGNGLSFSMQLDHLPEAFRQGPWREFKRFAERGNTFFIAPKPQAYPREVAYAWTRSAAIERVIPNKDVTGSVTLDCSGYFRP